MNLEHGLQVLAFEATMNGQSFFGTKAHRKVSFDLRKSQMCYKVDTANVAPDTG